MKGMAKSYQRGDVASWMNPLTGTRQRVTVAQGADDNGWHMVQSDGGSLHEAHANELRDNRDNRVRCTVCGHPTPKPRDVEGYPACKGCATHISSERIIEIGRSKDTARRPLFHDRSQEA